MKILLYIPFSDQLITISFLDTNWYEMSHCLSFCIAEFVTPSLSLFVNYLGYFHCTWLEFRTHQANRLNCSKYHFLVFLIHLAYLQHGSLIFVSYIHSNHPSSTIHLYPCPDWLKNHQKCLNFRPDTSRIEADQVRIIKIWFDTLLANPAFVSDFFIKLK